MNTHLALLSFFELVKETNRLAANQNIGAKDAQRIKIEFERMQGILGLSIENITIEQRQKIDGLILKREDHRTKKEFGEADKIRKRLNQMNVELIDHKERTVWMRKEAIRAERKKNNDAK